MASAGENVQDNLCNICYLVDPKYAFKCCFRNEEMRLCRACIDSLAISKIIKDEIADIPFDENLKFKLPCPFCRQDYDCIYDSNTYNEFYIEDFVNIPQTRLTAGFTKNHFTEMIAQMQLDLNARNQMRAQQNRRQLIEEVLIPLTRLLNTSFRRLRHDRD